MTQLVPAGPSPAAVVEVVQVPLPTPFGEFLLRAFDTPSGWLYLALTLGAVDTEPPPLVRVHSECLTGDALGSLRCDCGVQLRSAMRTIASEGRGALVYASGHEGRGIGLVNKLRAYVEQDGGADTVDANLRLGLAVDARDFTDAAAVLQALGIGAMRLLSNNPAKADALRAAGIGVTALQPLPTAGHLRNAGYTLTKERRLGHARPRGDRLDRLPVSPVDTLALLGAVTVPPDRPYVVLKYAQTLDGRIATADGDSRWISGEQERQVSHALRAACDAVMVGVGTVLRDDPQLTVRMVPGASPLRVVLDSTLRTPVTAQVLSHEAPTVVLTTARAGPDRLAALGRAGAGVRVVEAAAGGVDVVAAMASLRGAGVRSLLVEGGARVITSLLRAGVVDRLIVSVSPRIIGAGTEAVGDLGVARVADGLQLRNGSVHPVGEDVLYAWDVPPPAAIT